MRSLETPPGGYGDELADGEHAKQWAVVVGFALEAAQLFDGGTRVVLDLVEGGGVHDFLLLTGAVLLTVAIVSR